MKATIEKLIPYRLIVALNIVLATFFTEVAKALNDVTVRLYDQREMVAGNYSSFCTDAEGFVWIGTDGGLLCFDGNHSELFRNDELEPRSISDNKVFSLFCDSRGSVWAGTSNGLNCYDRNTGSFRLVKLPGLTFNGFIPDIVETPSGEIMFLVAGVGLYTVRPERAGELVAEKVKTGYKADDSISKIESLGNDGIVFSTRSGQVCRMVPGMGVEQIAVVDGNVSHMSVESPGTLILTTLYEVFRLNTRTHELTRLEIDKGKRIKITDIDSSDGITYLSTAGDGVWELRADSTWVRPAVSLHSSNLNLPMLKIGSVYMDDHANLWLGCNNKGVGMAPSSKRPFINKSLHDILRDSGGEVTCLDVVGEYILIGLNNGRVLLLDRAGNVRTVDVAQGVPVTSIAACSPGRALVGLSRDGIWSLDIASLKLTPLIKVGRAYPGVVLTMGSDGDVVAAFGEIGILKYNLATGEEKWYYADAKSQVLTSFYYSGISAMPDGKVWIGAYSGLACYDPAVKGLVPVDQTPFLNGVVHDICDAGDGSIMLATDKGLLKYSSDKGVIKKYTMGNGLPDNDVRKLVRDGRGGIWIGTMKGLAYLPSPDSKVMSYGGATGLTRKAYVFAGHIPLTDNLVVGDYESLTFFNPDSIQPSTFGGEVRITGIYLNGTRLNSESCYSGNNHILEGSITAPEVLHLSHNDNSLVVRLSTMDFRDASDLRYEWQFDREGETWHSGSPGDSYLYLPPLSSGRHTLRIRGWENDRSSDVVELKLDVKAPWYLSNMAYAVYILIALMIMGLLYKVVKNKREEELYEARIKYFMDISHEIRSPITLLLNPVEALLKQDNSAETTAQLLTVKRNAQRVLNLADQLLDLRKIEKGKMRLVYTPTDIKVFVEELVDMFRPQAEEKGLKIGFVTQEEHLWGNVDRNNLDKILVNLISNAIKYTPKGGEVTVELSIAKNAIGDQVYTIRVIDTGIGLDAKKIAHLFDRFYRNREHHQGVTPGFGIGLDLCLRLVALHKGVINGKNREDGVKGSVFTVTLPLVSVAPVETTMENRDRDAETAHNTHRAFVPEVVSVSDDGNSVRHRSSSRFRILVVDDDTELREYVKRNLGSVYKVVTVGSGEEALKALAERQTDLVVTDIRMEGIDGLELLRRIKGNMDTQHIPVILFSSSNGIDDRTRGWRQGADGYLAKPFSIAELEGMISGLLATRNRIKGKFSGNEENVNRIKAPKVKGMDEDLMKRVNQYINDNLSDPGMNVDSLSESVGLSRSQLHRRLKDILGMSPSDYIRNVKLRKACEILSHGDVDIAQVAYSLGFTAQSHFSTLFKRFTGLTPTDYRNLGKEARDKIIIKGDEMSPSG